MITSLIRKLYHQKIFSTIFPTTVSLLQKNLANCDTVLDLGCGPDSPLQFCHNVKDSVGVEAYKPYLTSSKKKKIHSEYINDNILNIDFPNKSFDAVIMIEVLEHLSKEEGKKIISRAKKWAKKKVIITTPNGFVKQASLDGNKLQNHLSGWTVSVLNKLGFTVHGLSGLKALRQEASNNSMGDDLTVSIRLRPKLLWFFVAAFSQSIIYHLPKMAYELFSVYKTNRIKSKSKKIIYSKKYYKNYQYGFTSTDRGDHKRIIELIKLNKNSKILDIGCGLGTFLSSLPIPKKNKFGIESNNYASKECRKNGLNVITHLDAEKLPFKKNYFDIVVINEVIEHLASPESVLKDIHRVTKINGLVVITTPNKNILVKNLDNTHISEMSYKELEVVVKKAKLKILKHEVSGFCLYDYVGRKIIFPLGKALSKLSFLNKSVNGIRRTVDSSKMSNFRTSYVYLGAQQLLLAKKLK